MKFGENLKKLRKAKNISQEELADKVGVSRQSVSKWETGDAYPEMNNILQLCKIFHCEINALVNDNMIDIDSLDEEIKMNVVKLKEEKQKKVKGFSKAIYIIARIGKVFTIIGFVALLVAMVVIPVVAANIKVNNNNSVKIFGEVISYERDDSRITVMHGNDKEVIKGEDEVFAFNKVIDYLENNNIPRVAVCAMLLLACIEVSIVLSYYALKHLEELFVNIHNGDTPFTMDNVLHIKKLAYLFIGVIILPVFGELIAKLFINSELGVEINLMDLVYILVLFSLSYIFEYGYQIQLDSNGKMYGDNNE